MIKNIIYTYKKHKYTVLLKDINTMYLLKSKRQSNRPTNTRKNENHCSDLKSQKSRENNDKLAGFFFFKAQLFFQNSHDSVFQKVGLLSYQIIRFVTYDLCLFSTLPVV